MEINGSELPSRGLVYDVKLEDIKIRTMKFGDEKLLAEMNFDNIEKKYLALLALVVKGIDVNKLTLGDRTHILLWEKINSYSPKIPTSFTCESCWQKVNIDIDLSKVNSKSLPEDFKEPYPITLSDEQVLNLRLLRVIDEIKILEWEKKLGGSSAYMYKWATSVVNDKDLPTRISDLEKLETVDGQKIKDFHTQHEHGPELDKVPYTCPKCGGENLLVLPFRPDFLIPAGQKSS